MRELLKNLKKTFALRPSRARKVPEPVLETPIQDRFISFIECFTYCFMVFVLVTFFIYLIFWAFFGCGGRETFYRVISTCIFLEKHWKFGFIIVIILFYRSVRRFVMRATRLGSIEAHEDPARPMTEVPPKPESYKVKAD